jgi:HSP20 family protein
MSSLFPVIRQGTFNNVSSAFEDMDRMVNAFFSPSRYENTSISKVNTMPRANVIKTNVGYSIELAAPGFSRDEFDIIIEDGALTVSLSSQDNEEYKSSIVAREYSYTSFSRSWKLPVSAMPKGIDARYEAGILTINVPVEDATSSSYKVEVQ